MPEVDRRVEAQPALVRADRVGELDAVAAVDLDIALVVQPGNAEHEDAVRLRNPLEHLVLDVVRVALQTRHERLDHLARRLVELGLRLVLRGQVGQKLLGVFLDVHQRASWRWFGFEDAAHSLAAPLVLGFPP